MSLPPVVLLLLPLDRQELSAVLTHIHQVAGDKTTMFINVELIHIIFAVSDDAGALLHWETVSSTMHCQIV